MFLCGIWTRGLEAEQLMQQRMQIASPPVMNAPELQISQMSVQRFDNCIRLFLVL